MQKAPLPCPFCGGPATATQIRYGFGNDAIMIRCPDCHIATEPVIADTYLLPKPRVVTLKQAGQIATDRWNKRVVSEGKKENAPAAVTAETQEKPKPLKPYSDFTTSGADLSIERSLT